MGLKPSPLGETFRFFDPNLDYAVWNTIALARIRVMT